MTITENDISSVMNDAISFLESAGIPVTPTNQYNMLGAWLDSFQGRMDIHALKMIATTSIAMMRLSHHVNPSLLV